LQEQQTNKQTNKHFKMKIKLIYQE